MLIHCVFPKLLDPIRKKFQTPELQTLTKLAYPEPKKESMYTKHRALGDPSLEGMFSKKLRKNNGSRNCFSSQNVGAAGIFLIRKIGVGGGGDGGVGGGGQSVKPVKCREMQLLLLNTLDRG